MLYKRAFRKEKEVVTFLVKDGMIKQLGIQRIPHHEIEVAE